MVPPGRALRQTEALPRKMPERCPEGGGGSPRAETLLNHKNLYGDFRCVQPGTGFPPRPNNRNPMF